MPKFKFTYATSVIIHASDEKAALAKWVKLNTLNIAEEMKVKPYIKDNQWEYLVDFENEAGESLCDPDYTSYEYRSRLWP